MQSSEFVRWYREEAEAVLVFHARRTFDPELALDLTAETFAEAWRCRHTLRAGSTVDERRGWLFTIARRQLSRYWRRGKVERKALEALKVQTPAAHEDDLAQIDERAGLPDLRAAMAAELARLSAGQRHVLELRVVQELGYAEVAAALGVSEQTARMRVSRALRALGDAADRNPVLRGAR